MHYTLLPSPLGEILLGFDDASLLGLWFVGQKDQPAIGPDWVRDDAHPIARRTADHLERYFRGEPADFDVPIRFRGTPFQVGVWRALQAISHGEVVSYAELARRVGSPAAVRAVGAAVGRNPVSIFVPCHRVVGSDGSLTGYAGGLPRKTHLLTLERVLDAAGRVRPRGAPAPSALPLEARA
ncbi:MAG: methylated-DNA--[protein]-cysteine S-methyltransferase [Burkholderiales bacterium]